MLPVNDAQKAKPSQSTKQQSTQWLSGNKRKKSLTSSRHWLSGER